MEISVRIANESQWTPYLPAVVGLFGVVLGALLSFGTNAWLAHSQRLRQARYLAIRVVCVLDPFVSNCCELVTDKGEPDPGAEGELSPSVSPHKLNLPTDVDWKSIGPGLAYRILTLSNRIEDADRQIAFVADMISFPPNHTEYFQERAAQYGEIGLAAATLADNLRKQFALPLTPGSWRESYEILRAASRGVKEADG